MGYEDCIDWHGVYRGPEIVYVPIHTLFFRDIKSLGGLRQVEGSLKISSGAPLESLGVLRTVKGSLEISGTKVKDLGHLRVVGATLDIRGSAVSDYAKLERTGPLLLEVARDPLPPLTVRFSVLSLYVNSCDLWDYSYEEYRESVEEVYNTSLVDLPLLRMRYPSLSRDGCLLRKLVTLRLKLGKEFKLR